MSAVLMPAQAGIGLRAQHHAAVVCEQPAVGWLEVHSENYFGRGGAAREYLARARARYPLSLHGVGLSIGSTDPLDSTHLAELSGLARDMKPTLISEHLSWGSVAGRWMNDLLPMPYTGEALRHVAQRVSQLQDHLGRQVLIENVSSYLSFRGPELTEWDFLAQLVRECGCGLLLDVNNIYVSAMNHGFAAERYLEAIPAGAVQEIHLAGHSVTRIGNRELRIDTHSTPVCPAVWSLYALALSRLGALPTLIEWDTDIPPLDTLVAEAHKADRIREGRRVAAA
jgi:uncharacterized protein